MRFLVIQMESHQQHSMKSLEQFIHFYMVFLLCNVFCENFRLLFINKLAKMVYVRSLNETATKIIRFILEFRSSTVLNLS